MPSNALLLSAGAMLAWAGATQAAPRVEVRDAVARVTVIPEDRTDVKVEILASNPGLPLAVRQNGERTIVDGDLKRRIRSCEGGDGRPRVRVQGLGEVGLAEMPQIVIRTPKDLNLEVGGAVFGAVGRTDALEFANAGCGDWTVGNVQGRLRISSAGSGGVRSGSAGDATVRLAGSGDISLMQVRGSLTIDLAGSGDVDVASIDGALDVKVAGSGDVDVRGGKASGVSVNIAGSGEMNFGGVADSLSARVVGSGDVHVGRVTGSVSRTIMGSGKVSVGD